MLQIIRLGGCVLKQIICLVFLILFLSAFVVPASSFASTTTNTPTDTNFGLVQNLSNLFSIFTSNNIDGKNQNTSNSTLGYYENNSNNWLDCILNWFNCDNKGGNQGGGDNCQCKDDKGTWSNDNGCVSSDEIWKKWYCY
jgi:hypothetical protein